MPLRVRSQASAPDRTNRPNRPAAATPRNAAAPLRRPPRMRPTARFFVILVGLLCKVDAPAGARAGLAGKSGPCNKHAGAAADAAPATK